MNSDLPKVAHHVADRAMVRWVVDACREAGCQRIVVVVGYGQDVVRRELADANVEFVVQDQQLGTGHAVRCAEPAFGAKPSGEVFVLAGDGPLIRAATLRTLLEKHRSTGASATLATSVIPDPSGYGRIFRDASGRFVAIVEEKNATIAQRAIREVNPSYYCFDAAALFESLAKVTRNEASGEYYVTDVPALLMSAGKRVEVIEAVPAEDVLSINTLVQLSEVDRIMRARLSGLSAGGQSVTAGVR